MKWQDCFELIENPNGACCRIGGDPEMDARYPKGYKIKNKATGEVSDLVSMTKYTAEHYANEMFKELSAKVDEIVL